MPGWLAATLRWTIAVAAAAGLILVLGPMTIEQFRDAVGVGQEDDEELPEVGPAVGPPPLEAGRAEAVADAGVSVGTVAQLPGPTVTVGPAGVETLLIGFDALPTDPACLAGVALEVYLHDGTETSVHALPARVDDLRELDDGQPLPADHLLDRSNPGTAYTTGAPGWLRFDVRSPYQLAARAADPDAPVVLAVTLPSDAEADAAVTFATVDDRPARLRWARIEGCEPDPVGGGADPLNGDDAREERG